MTVVERACKYVGAMDGSVSGQGGHNAAFAAACVLVHGFLLEEGVALDVLRNVFNPKCAPPWSDRELEHKVKSALAAGPGDRERGWLLKGGDVAGVSGKGLVTRPRPVAPEVKKRQEFDEGFCRKLAGGEVWEDWRERLLERSPVWPLAEMRPEDVFGVLFKAGEKVLVFQSEFSQGNFGVFVREGGKAEVYRLGDRPGVDAVRVDGLPKGGPAGMWFLAAPVSGKWEVGSGGKMTRRSHVCVTAWRYMVLESDEAAPEVWVPALCRLSLPVAAIYESGGRSVHALLRVDARSKGEWDGLRDRLSPLLTKFGCDGGAMSAVRLSRVPNVMRYGKRVAGKDGRSEVERFEGGGRLQRLLFLDGEARVMRLADLPRRRRV